MIRKRVDSDAIVKGLDRIESSVFVGRPRRTPARRCRNSSPWRTCFRERDVLGGVPGSDSRTDVFDDVTGLKRIIAAEVAP